MRWQHVAAVEAGVAVAPGHHVALLSMHEARRHPLLLLLLGLLLPRS
jgi:hypothetical protein